MFYLPNRAYYPAVKSLTHDQFVETVDNVLQYAALELFSLAVLCKLLDRLLGFSTLRMLAFALRSHAVLAQSQLTLWVFMSTQLSLEHFGTLPTSAHVGAVDYTRANAVAYTARRVRLHVPFCMAASSSQAKHSISRQPLSALNYQIHMNTAADFGYVPLVKS
jgi:hypothetical protein